MKSAGSSVEVAFIQNCGAEDVSTGTGYIEETESQEYDYFERNNRVVVKTLKGEEAKNFLLQRGKVQEADNGTEVDLTTVRYAPHMSPRMIQNSDRDRFESIRSYYKVSIVRNPWEALVSYFWWAFYEPPILGDTRKETEKYSPITMPHIAPLVNDPAEVLQQKFQLFLENPAVFKTPYRKSKEQTIFEWFSDWQKEFYDDVDHLMMYDNLQSEYDDLCQKFNVATQKLPRLKTTQRKSAISHKYYYNDMTHSMVHHAFKDVIEKFNFSI